MWKNFQHLINKQKNRKTRTKLAASEAYWRLPSSPIVENKTVVSLCKFKSVLIYTWIAKPFILPLQIFRTHELSFRNRKTRTKLAASEGHWRLPSSPIVKKKHVHFPTVVVDSREICIEYVFRDCFQNSRAKCIGSPNPYIYRCKFFRLYKTIHFFKKLERNSPHMRHTGGSWLRQ